MSDTLHFLSIARSALASSSLRADEIHSSHKALVDRLAAAKQKSADAVSAFNAGTVDEPTSALRRAIAEADAKDLENLIDASVPAVAEADAARGIALQKVGEAEASAHREELRLTGAELDKQIALLEQTFLHAIAERYRVHISLNGTRGGQSTFVFYKPSQPLQELITRSTPPNA